MERQNQRLFRQFTDAVQAQEEAIMLSANRELFKELDSEEWVTHNESDSKVY